METVKVRLNNDVQADYETPVNNRPSKDIRDAMKNLVKYIEETTKKDKKILRAFL